jgi:hypothetical protein
MHAKESIGRVATRISCSHINNDQKVYVDFERGMSVKRAWLLGLVLGKAAFADQ